MNQNDLRPKITLMPNHISFYYFFSGLLILICLSLPLSSVAADKRYALNDLYRMALEKADQLEISRQEIVIANQTREKALSVLKPRFSAVSSYKRYKGAEYQSGFLLQPKWTGSYGITVGQSFTLNGREITALKMANTNIEKSKYDLSAAQSAYLLEVASAFYNAAKTKKAVDISNTNVKRLEAHKNAVLAKLKLAEVPKTELFRTEAELSKAQTSLIQAVNGKHLAISILARLVGADQSFEINEPDTPSGLNEKGGPVDLVNTALNNRYEIKSLESQEKIAQDQIKYEKGAYWPTIGIEGGYMALDQSPEEFALKETAYIGFNLNFEFYDGGLRKAQITEAKAQKKQASLALSDIKQEIKLEVDQALHDVITQRSVISSLESQLDYAGANYNAIKQLFDHGMANSVDVMDANTLLVTAQNELSDANYNLKIALLVLKKATGTFLSDVNQSLAVDTK